MKCITRHAVNVGNTLWQKAQSMENTFNVLTEATKRTSDKRPKQLRFSQSTYEVRCPYKVSHLPIFGSPELMGLVGPSEYLVQRLWYF